MKQIVWLASYPKSGNTWFRAFLANYLRDAEEPVDINELDTGGIASARYPLDSRLGYDSQYLTSDDIDNLRPTLYAQMAADMPEDGEPLFLKVHDAYTLLPNGEPLFPPEVSRCVLYFVRNPLDVCVSYAHHSGKTSYTNTAINMGKPNFAMNNASGRYQQQLRQRMLSWSSHVLSWINAKGHRVCLIRYEDMKEKTFETFASAVVFLGLPDDRRRIEKAIRFSSFDVLRSQEEKRGFREKLHVDQSFFRKGKVGSWRESLMAHDVQQITDDHSLVMQRFGYEA